MANFVVVGENDGGVGMLPVSINYLFGIMFIVGVVLMSDSNQWSSGDMDGEVEIATNVGMRTFDDW